MVEHADLIREARYAKNGRGPTEFDCYGLLREMKRREGVLIPNYITPEAAEGRQLLLLGEKRVWAPCAPKAGAAIAFRIMGYVQHVGYQLDPWWFIHCWEGSRGVLRERISDWQRRIEGFYEYVGEQ